MQESDIGNLIRKPAVAGQFYPNDPGKLRDEIMQAFTSPLGPGAIPAIADGPRKVMGIVVPHAGYQYSAQSAAWAYAEIAADGRPEVIVLLGVNHRGIGAELAVSTAKAWQTPLGTVPVADNVRQHLLELDSQLVLDESAHRLEHSLEVQVPFIQQLFGVIPIVPVAIGHISTDDVFQFGHALALLAQRYDILFVASSDLSHYISYREAEVLDRLALQAIADLDPEELVNVVRRRAISMCGMLPVATMLTTAKDLGISTGKILHYHTSGDVTGERQEVVGYGAAALYR